MVYTPGKDAALAKTNYKYEKRQKEIAKKKKKEQKLQEKMVSSPRRKRTWSNRLTNQRRNSKPDGALRQHGYLPQSRWHPNRNGGIL